MVSLDTFGTLKREKGPDLSGPVELRPFGHTALRVTGGTRRLLLIVYDLVVSLDHVFRGASFSARTTRA
jgi:hypothetical protein